ncbi:hypothetical protein QUB05_11125 [Microcoleus sp. F10-C6]|uniref:hypothetical protein n=1 Tax=Microcoleus sp. F10-C6 TaxID=2818757 RepID=UPI002FCFE0C6
MTGENRPARHWRRTMAGTRMTMAGLLTIPAVGSGMAAGRMMARDASSGNG